MAANYFQRVMEQTPTRLWINNPSAEDVVSSLATGAIHCTTNPSYCSKLLQREAGYLRGLIDDVIRKVEDNDLAAERVYLQASGRIMQMFLPLHKSSGRKLGYVTGQDDPRRDEDADEIVKAALRGRELAPNFMAKIPVIESGMAAIEELVVRDVPVCATEIFSVTQAIDMCERYKRAADRSGNHPPFFVTHITGILDQYWVELVKSEQIDIAPEVLKQAGCTVARKEYQILKERGYEGTLLGGGVRDLHHFTEFVGGDVHITMNWGTMQEIIGLDPPVESRIDAPTAPELVEELEAKLPNFRRAHYVDAIRAGEYGDFGPLVFFRAMFLNGYSRLLDEVAERRALL